MTLNASQQSETPSDRHAAILGLGLGLGLGVGLGLRLGVKVCFYMISGIAIVSKTNDPVILRSYVDTEDGTPTTSWREVGDSDDHSALHQLTFASAELRLQHVVYCSLDAEAWASGRGKRNDGFIGYLNAMDNFR